MLKNCLIICNEDENSEFGNLCPYSTITNTQLDVFKEIFRKHYNTIAITEDFIKSNELILPALQRYQNLRNINPIIIISDKNYYFENFIVTTKNNLNNILKEIDNKLVKKGENQNYGDLLEDFLILNTFDLLTILLLEKQDSLDEVFKKLSEILETALMPAGLILGEQTSENNKIYVSQHTFIDETTIKTILSKNNILIKNLIFEPKQNEHEYTKYYLENSKIFFLNAKNMFLVVIFGKEQVKDFIRIENILNLLFERVKEIVNIKSKIIAEYKVSITDYLTGIYNRRFFDEFLKKELKIANRSKSNISLMIFDIDYFKSINDTYGHSVGDEILISLCKLVSKLLRKSDIFARIGGEEFAILLPNTDEKGSYYLAEKIRTTVEEETFIVDTFEIKFTISIGLLVGINVDKLDYNTIYKLTDDALYEAKKRGRNQTFKSIF